MSVIQKKICLLGDFAVGKTSLVRQFVEGRFDDRYIGTIGVKVSRKSLSRPYGSLNLLVWDMTGGKEIGSPHRTSYLQGAAGAIIVCDLTRRETLNVFERYAQEMHILNPQTSLTFVGNKVDMVESRVVSESDLQAVCRDLAVESYFITSAKTGEQVENAFLNLAEQIEAKI